MLKMMKGTIESKVQEKLDACHEAREAHDRGRDAGRPSAAALHFVAAIMRPAGGFAADESKR